MILTGISGLSDPETVTKAMSKNMEQWQDYFQVSMKNDPSAEKKI